MTVSALTCRTKPPPEMLASRTASRIPVTITDLSNFVFAFSYFSRLRSTNIRNLRFPPARNDMQSVWRGIVMGKMFEHADTQS